MERILLLVTALSWADACEALLSAKDHAAAPERVSYGVSLQEEPTEDDLAGMRAIGSIQYVCPGADAWLDGESLWQGEGFILMGHPAMRFERHWDMALLHALRQCGRNGLDSCVLTGYLPRPSDPVDAVYPVAAEGFDQQGQLCFHRGTALRYARVPQRSAFLHPDFCFASSAFLREMAEDTAQPLFFRAHCARWDAYTLHTPVIRMMWDQPLMPESPVITTEEDKVQLSRFEKRYGLRIALRQLTAQARQGVFTADLRFLMHVPYPVRLQEKLREIRYRRSKVNPLCVTALLIRPQMEDSLKEEYLSWFGYLVGMKNIALLAYAEGAVCRQLTAIHPNVLEYKQRYGLPVKDVPEEDALRYVRLCKPFLLGQSREKMLGHSHYVWVDFGYLRYPVYAGASINWDEVCTDRITMATVDGRLDPSMIVIPQQHVLPICREIAALCQTAVEHGEHLPEETEMWERLMQEHPDLFTTVEMPGRRELMTLTLTSREEEFHARA